MIAGFNEWAATVQLGRSASFEQLKERRLGIEAEDYINDILTNSPTKEPLLPALGGLPFALEEIVKGQISILKEHGIQPFFVFSGLKLNGQEDKLQASLKATKSIANAWELYNASEPERAVSEFGTLCKLDTQNQDAYKITVTDLDPLGTLDVDHIYRYIQSIFRKNNVDFLVAPYSSCAQVSSFPLFYYDNSWTDHHNKACIHRRHRIM